MLLLELLVSGPSIARPFSRGFFPGLRLRLAAEDDVGEDADDDVEVVELGLAFLDLSPAGLAEESGARVLRCLLVLLRSLALPGKDSGSEQGFRNGDRLSLSRRNTTAIDPPTTEGPAAPPTTPPGPRRSIPSLLEFPVVLLTPSRTSTDTLDWSLAFLLPPPSFLDLPERPDSFLPPFSFPALRLLAVDEDAAGGRVVVLPEEADRGGESEGRRFLLFALGL